MWSNLSKKLVKLISSRNRKKFINWVYLRRKDLILADMFLVLALIILFVSMANKLVDKQRAYYQNQLQIAKLRLENQVLQDKVAKESALNTIEVKAHGLGFQPIKNLLYIK